MRPLFDVIFKKCSNFVIKHSVEIAMGAAAVGVGLTVFTTSKATLKVNDICKDETLTKSEKIKKSVKPVAPAAASVLLAYAGIAAMYITGRKKQAALLGLLVSSQQVFQQYRNNTRKSVGMEKEKELYSDAVAESKNLDKEIPNLRTCEDEFIFCDSITGQWFVSTFANFWASAYDANVAFHEYGMFGFNQWLQFLGCDEEEIIDEFGWCREGAEYYDYSSIQIGYSKRECKGRTYYLVTYTTLPHSMFLYPYDKGCADEDLVLKPMYETELWQNTPKEKLDDILETDIKRLSPRG